MTHCRKGHEFTPENTYVSPKRGNRQCKLCMRVRQSHYYDANIETILARHVAHYNNNTEKAIVRARDRRKANPEKVSAEQAAWRKANPDKKRAQNQRHRARTKNALGLWWGLIPQLIPAMLQMQGNSCAYCRKSFIQDERGKPIYHLEHMIPIKRGGTHGFDNVVLSCPSCNVRKGTKTKEEFLCLTTVSKS